MPQRTRFLVEVCEPEGFVVTVDGGDGVPGEASLAIPLSVPRLARGLSDITLLLAATSGELTPGLQRHFTEHFASDATPQGRCEFCKLQGKILGAEGRKRLSDREDRARVIPPGLTLGATERAAEAKATREADRVRKLPKLGSGRRGDVGDAWF